MEATTSNETKTIEKLLNNGLFESAELVASFFLDSPDVSVDMLIQYAQTLCSLEEYRRAVKYYNMALDKLKKNKDVSLVLENNIKQDIAECLIKLKQTKSALNLLKEIHLPSMSCKSLLRLAKLVAQFGKRKAVPYYKQLLSNDAYATEAAIAMIEIGMSDLDYREMCRKLPQTPWLQKLFDSHHHKAKVSYIKAIESFEELLNQFPTNIHILLNLALCNYYEGNPSSSLNYFKKIRQIDPYFVDKMDIYGSIIKSEGKLHELNILSHDLLQANPYRAETWTTIAMYYDAKGKKEKALFHVEKAIDCDSMNAMSYVFKGSLCKSLKQYNLAVDAFQNAKKSQKDLFIYKGLVEALVAYQDVSAALKIATEAQKYMPNNLRVTCLTGYVLAHLSESQHQNKAREVFDEILKKDPSCLDAVVGKAILFTNQHSYDDAINFLKEYLEKYNLDFLHTTLGDVYVAAEKYDEALVHYSNALKINQLCEAALKGVELVEKQKEPGVAENDEDNDFPEDALDGDTDEMF